MDAISEPTSGTPGRRRLRTIAVLIVAVIASTVALLGATEQPAQADTCPPGSSAIGNDCFIYRTTYICTGPHTKIVGRTCYTTFWGQEATYPAVRQMIRIPVAKVPCPPKAPKTDSGSAPSYPVFAKYSWPPGYTFGF